MENIKRIEHTETAAEEAVEPVNPMEELNHSIEDLRGKLRTLLDESALLARKVKEAVLQQKQREREEPSGLSYHGHLLHLPPPARSITVDAESMMRSRSR